MSDIAAKDSIVEKAQSFSCPTCGGRAVYDPESQNLKCPYCGAMTAVDTLAFVPNEYPIEEAPDSHSGDWGKFTRIMRCKGCGAEIILEANVASDVCAFCGSPHIAEEQGYAGIAPESILPFLVAQDSASVRFRNWLRKKPFAPSKAKKLAELGKIAGVYLPHWTYDSHSTSLYRGQAGHYYYVTVPVTVQRNGKTVTEMRQERRTRWEPASGVVSNVFDDIMVAGSKRLPETLLSRVRPFDMKQLVRYQPEFLAGFISEKPSVDVREGWVTAQEIIDLEMRALARQDILRHADEANVTDIQTENKDVRYKLTLLPMYLSAFKYKNKSFNVLVNGQNGKVGGQAPVSPLRVLIAILLGIAIIACIYYLFGNMPA
jgi:predicted RNA-binding Zn-ribbon protein involved in translation (DUF1610 family)